MDILMELLENTSLHEAISLVKKKWKNLTKCFHTKKSEHYPDKYSNENDK